MKGLLIDPFKQKIIRVDDQFMSPDIRRQYLAQGRRGSKQYFDTLGPRPFREMVVLVDEDADSRPNQRGFLWRGEHTVQGYMLVLATEVKDAERKKGVMPPLIAFDRDPGVISDYVDWIPAEAFA